MELTTTSKKSSDKPLGKSFDHVTPYALVVLPEAGPLQNEENAIISQKSFQNTLTGYVESTVVHPYDFEVARIQERQTYTKKFPSNATKKRKPMGDPADIDNFNGPWAQYVATNQESNSTTPTSPNGPILYGVTAEERVLLEEEKAKEKQIKHNKELVRIDPGQERSIFHGKAEHDFLGRTYMHMPTISLSSGAHLDLSNKEFIPETFPPKKLLHTYTGHNKGITCVQVFPTSGHLILSASLDAKIKLWDVYNDRKVLRTFIGHNKAVRHVALAPQDGAFFVSSSYDHTIKMWDTETGSCRWHYSLPSSSLPHALTLYPDDPRLIMIGASDHRIYQLDSRLPSDEAMVLEYNEHLEAINTVTFIDQNRRFMTTSDDKSIRFWEFGLPVTVKMIAEPHMHAITSVCLHPNGKIVAAQSQDNQILTYTTGVPLTGDLDTVSSNSFSSNSYASEERFRLYRKRFAGHITSGYACQLGFSPDGQYLFSGDSIGKLWLWDWKTGKIVKNIKAHDKVLISAQWLPKETSKIVTASWDGSIKLWD